MSKIKKITVVVCISIVATILVNAFIVEPCHIISNSMEHTVASDSWVWIDKISYVYESPTYADLIIFEGLENNENQFLIKRVVGLPGDAVELFHGILFINNTQIQLPGTIVPTQEAHDSYVAEFPVKTTWSIHNYGPIIVPGKKNKIIVKVHNYSHFKTIIEKEGNHIVNYNGEIYINGKPDSVYQFKQDYYFVLGDNRSCSRDSRFFGFVPESAIIGKAWRK